MKKQRLYTLTHKQIQEIKKEAYDQALQTIYPEIAKKSFLLMLTIPLEVLITEEYWMDVAREKMPIFIEEVLALYNAHEAGSITLEEMEDDLWEFAGVRMKK